MFEIRIISKVEGTVTEPVTLTEAKAWLNVDHSDDDTLITSMIKGARQSIENYCAISLVEKDIVLELSTTREERVPMPYTTGLTAPVIQEYDSDDVLTTLTSGDDYYLRGGNIRIGEGSYNIAYTTEPGTIPQDLKEAIMMEVAERYLNRGENDTTEGLSKSAKQKAAPYQVIWL